ncbi:hypothetical protein DFP93_101202 [Aneurinibacillus soli]|uniref:Large polyvalent protein associated domain-containing protein n=1 Tax=Aneurinibacillus soli TaxID=1500254 RepID=A0A0U5BIW8_9BACL|nr:LPD29 domain-containing protein [Aneurinibacillus soli]PYE64177.1 hypothetical protein DFP93_101202 [Aneurinibacillus soli]BAU28126.1 hypothetical protein CB4_02300 [Aneurinibacillus soli]
MADVVEIAKQIRTVLKKEFPATKFSVRSERYSLGASIRVSWDGLPSTATVSTITDSFAKVRYCDATGEILSGGNMFITAQASETDEVRAAIMERMDQELIEQYEQDHSYFRRYREEYNRIADELYAERLAKWQAKKAERKQSQTSAETTMITEEVAQISEPSESVTITLNEEKNGIEVSFGSKPAPEVLAQLKAHGFRWFQPKKAWIAKQTPERLGFAQSLSGESSTGDPSTDSQPAEPQLTDAQQVALDARLSKPNVKPLRLFQDKDGHIILECVNTSLETPYPFCFMWDIAGNQKRSGAAEKFELEKYTLIREYQNHVEHTVFSHPELTSEQNKYISTRLAHWQKTGIGVPVRLYKSDQYDWVLLECIHRDGKTMYMRIFEGWADFIYNFTFINRDSFVPIHDFTTEQGMIPCTV